VDKTSEFLGRHGVEIVGHNKAVSRADTWLQAWDQIWHW